MSHNTLLHRALRPLVGQLARTSVRPDHVTYLRIVTAAGAAGAFGLGTPDAIRVGAVAFVASALLDRVDGDLARRTRCFSRNGHTLDLVADCGADMLVFLAMGVGASDGWLRGWSMVLGGLAAAGTSQMFRQLSPTTTGQAGVRANRLFDPDDLVLVVPLLACCAGLPAVLLLAGSVTPLAALWLTFMRRAR